LPDSQPEKMVDNTPWFLLHPQDRITGSNHDMVDELVRSGALKKEECISALKSVDRRHFWPAEAARFAYADTPLRSGRLHLSAPHIYAKALESLLPLSPGMSFLNVGSGTGYFNSVVSELIGPLATNHGVEIWPETVAHARQRCGALNKGSIEFTVGNIYQLDVHFTTRYDRIYLGACANSKSKYLYRLLEVDGVLIGPFQMGHAQQLRKVTRISETQFHVEVLGAVQFACLVEPDAVPLPPPPPPPVIEPEAEEVVHEEDEEGEERTAVAPRAAAAAPYRFAPRPRAGPGRPRRRTLMAPSPVPSPASGASSVSGQRSDEGGPLGLPGVPFAFSLSERPWCLKRSRLYPESFQDAVRMGLICRPKDPQTVFLPAEVWVNHIFPWCGRHWFDSHEKVRTPCKKKARDIDSDSEGRGRLDSEAASTRAPSSAQTTPASGPSASPELSSPDQEIDMGGAAEDLERKRPSALVEVYMINGRRHVIGAGLDPDDMEDDGPRMVVPFHVLQILAQNNAERRHQLRRQREVEQDEDGHFEESDEDDGEEDEDEEDRDPDDDEDAADGDEVMVAAAVGAVDGEGDADGMEVEEEPSPAMADTEAADMVLT